MRLLTSLRSKNSQTRQDEQAKGARTRRDRDLGTAEERLDDSCGVFVKRLRAFVSLHSSTKVRNSRAGCNRGYCCRSAACLDTALLPLLVPTCRLGVLMLDLTRQTFIHTTVHGKFAHNLLLFRTRQRNTSRHLLAYTWLWCLPLRLFVFWSKRRLIRGTIFLPDCRRDLE